MVTRGMGKGAEGSAIALAIAFACAAAAVAAGCGGSSSTVAAGGGPGGARPSERGAPPPLPPDTVDPGGSGPVYPGTGFRVHEWGTNTIVVGSGGAMQRGMQHEEEDLPSFVYDRRHQELAVDPHDVKMETPVTYFYSDKPLVVDAQVRFPKGILTQWFPAVTTFAPPFFTGGDPALDAKYPFTSAACREQLARVADGVLRWNQIAVLPRGEAIAPPSASLAEYTWSHARDVAANGLRIKGAATQDERFLFYRGLGNLDFDVKVTAPTMLVPHGVHLVNTSANEKTGAVFVLRVEADKASFVVHPGGVAPGATLEDMPLAESAPAAQPLDAYAQALAKAMVTELDCEGLYHDESIAMVKTWARQWFRTPGTRVLYLAPRAWTEQQIPLDVTPAPEEIVRVMVIRVEVLTKDLESIDFAAMNDLAGGAERHARGVAHFRSLGRFAEPRLRNAMASAAQPPAAANVLLDSIATADVRVRAWE